MDIANPDYWNNRYLACDHPWDLGKPSRPLMEIMKEYGDRQDIRILLPGAGNAPEAEVLLKQGFSELYVLDWSPVVIDRLKQQLPDFPADHLLCEDFFAHAGQYDLILEQTFFCALPPAMRQDYVDKMHDLLVPGGALRGVFFEFPLKAEGPPFGGNAEMYRELFQEKFKINQLSACQVSEPERQDKELIFHFTALPGK